MQDEDQVRAFLLAETKRQGIDLKQLSIEMGRNHAYFQQYIRRRIPERLPHEARIWLAERLKVPAGNLQSRGAITLPPIRPSEELRPEATRRGRADFKIFGTAEGGAGAVILSSDPIESREWPDVLVGVPGGYGLLITGTSMIPALRPGDIALVHPHLPARPDDEVILQREDHGTRHGMVKTLIRQSATEYKLKQWNPAKEFTRSKKEWPLCHLVVGKFRR